MGLNYRWTSTVKDVIINYEESEGKVFNYYMIHTFHCTTVFIKMLIYVPDNESDIDYSSDKDIDDQSDCEC